jgi:hypothetical protein
MHRRCVMVLRLDLRVGVLTDAKNNGMQGHEGYTGTFLLADKNLSTESRGRGTHGTHPCQQPPSAWQASLDHINQIFLF